jgi:hypothetical protein
VGSAVGSAVVVIAAGLAAACLTGVATIG